MLTRWPDLSPVVSI